MQNIVDKIIDRCRPNCYYDLMNNTPVLFIGIKKFKCVRSDQLIYPIQVRHLDAAAETAKATIIGF